MPNGGLICCLECVNNSNGSCSIHGVKCNAYTVCCAFQTSNLSHKDSREKYKSLQKMKPGVVYQIQNTADEGHGQTKEIFVLVKKSDADLHNLKPYTY